MLQNRQFNIKFLECFCKWTGLSGKHVAKTIIQSFNVIIAMLFWSENVSETFCVGSNMFLKTIRKHFKNTSKETFTRFAHSVICFMENVSEIVYSPAQANHQRQNELLSVVAVYLKVHLVGLLLWFLPFPLDIGLLERCSSVRVPDFLVTICNG